MIRTPDRPAPSVVAIPNALLRLLKHCAKLGNFLQMVSNGNLQHIHFNYHVTSVTAAATWCKNRNFNAAVPNSTNGHDPHVFILTPIDTTHLPKIRINVIRSNRSRFYK
jgi:hypothetical protein